VYGGAAASLRARVDAGEGGEVRGHVLAQLRARDRPAALRGLAELVDPVAALEHGDDAAGAADRGDGEDLVRVRVRSVVRARVRVRVRVRVGVGLRVRVMARARARARARVRASACSVAHSKSAGSRSRPWWYFSCASSFELPMSPG